ncbi:MULTISPECIES: hypothetical protein [Streptomyces]|jgi:hypothetical protein|uniref:Matrixin family metalloprotease n=1 Tax=Streptomyces bottropensis TaxID=42235 RepID=A0ABU8ALH8_9ACTN|nr:MULTISPECIES: hypothetical protein [Streptomyces]MZD21434.1 hypothetical protein [Streptomyces sp. SID5476]
MAFNRRTAFIGAAAAVTVVAGATVVQAAYTDNMYPTANYGPRCVDGELNDTFCQTDNRALTIYSEKSLDSAERRTISRTVKDFYGPTDLAVQVSSSGVYKGDSETDIIYKSKRLYKTVVGVTWCDDAVTSRKCDQHHILINSDHSEMGKLNKWHVCHETGHAVGLTHGTEANPRKLLRDPALGCMSYDPTYRLGANNRDNINSTY